VVASRDVDGLACGFDESRSEVRRGQRGLSLKCSTRSKQVQFLLTLR
jgi:hypothetical protein